MSANSLNLDIYDLNSSNAAVVRDPGDAGTIASNNFGLVRCELESAGAETRTLEAASKLPSYTDVTLVCKTYVGDITVTAGTNVFVFSAAGQAVRLIVVPTAAGNVWSVIGSSLVNVNGVNLSTAPAALGTVNINSGDAGTDAAIILLADALQAMGLVTHTWT